MMTEKYGMPSKIIKASNIYISDFMLKITIIFVITLTKIMLTEPDLHIYTGWGSC